MSYKDTPAIAFLTGFYNGYIAAHPQGRSPQVITVSSALYDAYVKELSPNMRFSDKLYDANAIKWLAFRAARVEKDTTWTIKGRD